MDRIIISDGVTTVVMPRTRNVTDAGTPEYREVKMAGGKIVREMVGFRTGFKYDWDYVPAATITTLTTMLKKGGFFSVEYFDPSGTDGSGVFSVSYPSLEVFGFKDGVAVWHTCALTILSQEVV